MSDQTSIASATVATVQDTFTIGELAKQLGISTRTIRYYEERGLITPERSSGRQRVYTRRDRGRLKLILRAKASGLDLQESKEILDLYDILPSDKVEQAQAKNLESMVNRRLDELEAKIEEMTLLQDDLREHLASLRQKTHGSD